MTAERELATWRELGAYAADRQLPVRFSLTTGRAYVTDGDVIVWAHVGDAKLPAWEPGGALIGRARSLAWLEANPVDPEYAAKVAAVPDPPEWQQNAYLERHPR